METSSVVKVTEVSRRMAEYMVTEEAVDIGRWGYRYSGSNKLMIFWDKKALQLAQTQLLGFGDGNDTDERLSWRRILAVILPLFLKAISNIASIASLASLRACKTASPRSTKVLASSQGLLECVGVTPR